MHGRRRALTVLAVWAALVAIAAPLALGGSDHLTGGGFEVPGSGSAKTEAALQRGVSGDLRGTMLGAVLVAPRGAPRADYVAALDALTRADKATPEVSLLPQTKEAALYFATERPGRPVIVPFITGVDEFHAPDVGKKLRRELGLADGRHYGQVKVHLIGQGALWAGMVDLTKDDLASAERVGFPVVLLILLAVFGSLAAAALPLVMGGVAVLITGGLIEILARHTLMSFYTPNMASMIGLGVAVDYSLFVVVRYREELRGGVTPEEARRIAMRTSGVAVGFSGVAVVIALGRAAARPDRRDPLDGRRRDPRRPHLDAGVRDAAARAADHRGQAHQARQAQRPLVRRLGAPGHRAPRSVAGRGAGAAAAPGAAAGRAEDR